MRPYKSRVAGGSAPILPTGLIAENNLTFGSNQDVFDSSAAWFRFPAALTTVPNCTSWRMDRQGSPTGTIAIEIRSESGGVLLATSNAVDVTTIPTANNSAWTQFTFTGAPQLVQGTFYRLQTVMSAGDASNNLRLKSSSSFPTDYTSNKLVCVNFGFGRT